MLKTAVFSRFRIGILGGLFVLGGCSSADDSQSEIQNLEPGIDRKALITRHNPSVNSVDANSPFSLGNGQFAYTSDVTGFQNFENFYHEEGIPLESKARWAWHSRESDKPFSLSDTNVAYKRGKQKVFFPTDDSGEAGQWLRQNPHDLPLANVALNVDGKRLDKDDIQMPRQTLDMWQGLLSSHFLVNAVEVNVQTIVDNAADRVAYSIVSPLFNDTSLSFSLRFPRGYDMNVKNTPAIDYKNANEHLTTIISQSEHSVILERQIDDHRHWVKVEWSQNGHIEKSGEHNYVLKVDKASHDSKFDFSIEFSQEYNSFQETLNFSKLKTNVAAYWKDYWIKGAAIDFTGSESMQAHELERRIVLSQYLMAIQERADIPAQETGLTSSSWYGKFHTEMTWWHSAHWPLWNRPEPLSKVLSWYKGNLPYAKETANNLMLEGARWSKMVGPDGRESPGGNPLIIWNQPQPILLAELLYNTGNDEAVLEEYRELVEQTALTLSSMLIWEESKQRYSLKPPIWIAQEHYDVRESENPTFELSYWREGLNIAQKWRERSGLERNPQWDEQLQMLAQLPIFEEKYVAIESIPDTFTNIESRNDHPAMLGSLGVLQDKTVDKTVMMNTLHEVIENWDFQTRIWGWDYPMIAMTATRLNEPQVAIDAMLMDAHNNTYLNNGHCPQKKVGLPVYLPANGALLSAVALMATTNKDSPYLGFPSNGKWTVRAEGF